MGADEFLHALDRVALIVEPFLDCAQRLDVFGAIVAPAARALQRLDLRKPRFPKSAARAVASRAARPLR